MRFDSGGHYIQKTQSVEIAEALSHWAKTTLFPDTVQLERLGLASSTRKYRSGAVDSTCSFER